MSVLTKEKEKKNHRDASKTGRERDRGGSYVSDDLLFDFLS
jgi:hypothetical protein